MAKLDFIEELKILGFAPQELDAQKVVFEYEVPLGGNIGKKIFLGFEIPTDFPMNCPTGPHFKSIGIESWIEPKTNINPSPFGPEWRYWSRPFPNWNQTDKKVKTYLAHIKNLLTTV